MLLSPAKGEKVNNEKKKYLSHKLSKHLKRHLLNLSEATYEYFSTDFNLRLNFDFHVSLLCCLKYKLIFSDFEVYLFLEFPGNIVMSSIYCR